MTSAKRQVRLCLRPTCHIPSPYIRRMGMDCWTLLGIKKLSRSLLFAARRDLIKILPPFPPQEVVVKVFGGKGTAPGKENF